jgi:hypothetical protein
MDVKSETIAVSSAEETRMSSPTYAEDVALIVRASGN